MRLHSSEPGAAVDALAYIWPSAEVLASVVFTFKCSSLKDGVLLQNDQSHPTRCRGGCRGVNATARPTHPLNRHITQHVMQCGAPLNATTPAARGSVSWRRLPAVRADALEHVRDEGERGVARREGSHDLARVRLDARDRVEAGHLQL